jgi:4-carboxymuconolactone decarboxylase
MPRVALPAAGELTPEQRRVYDSIGALRRGHVPVHYHAALCNPELADKWQQIGDLLRYRTSLPLRLSELAILVTACDQRCDYQWAAHQPIAAKAGLAPDVISAIRTGRRPAFTASDEAAVYDYCTMLLQTKFVDDDTHSRATAAVGARGIVELTALLGYYVMVAMSINAHDLAAAPDTTKR